MKRLLRKGDDGPPVRRLAAALARELGDEANDFKVLQEAEPAIDEEFLAAVRRWQAGIGVIADGIVGPLCQMLLELAPEPALAGKLAPLEVPLSVAAVSQLFPGTKPANIARYLPYVEAALMSCGLTDRAMVLASLAVIRVECEGFVPMVESRARAQTSHEPQVSEEAGPGQSHRVTYRGRGFVRLRGKTNYVAMGKLLELPLVEQPELATAPEVAALVLAQLLSEHRDAVQAALQVGDLDEAHDLLIKGSHGKEAFKKVFEQARTAWEAAPAMVGAGASSQARRESVQSSKTKKDAPDLRDRPYQPQALSLPAVFPGAEHIEKYLSTYTHAELVLNQGREGACTGFGLACVVNYLRWIKEGNPETGFELVSPRMLYTLARRHDEYEGENYEGSSCRGAIKGWHQNGVCLERDWPYSPERSNTPKYGYAKRAAEHTLGVYYRIEVKSVTDMQAAIAQHGAVFVSAFTHDGWFDVPNVEEVPKRHQDLPLIQFDGRPSQDGGHAFALVGFDTRGFIVQNSWGRSWGSGGFGVLSYLDWLANGMDAWVVSLGVPGVIEGRLAASGATGAAAAAGGGDRSKWWDSGTAYQHSIVLGNEGRVARYLTEDERPRKLQHQAYALPDQWFRSAAAGAAGSERKRLVIYVHGGLNDEAGAIKRVSAMGRFFIANGCYPLFLVWKTGLLETIGNVISDRFQREPALAGSAEWFTDKTDLLIEKTIGRPIARPLWSEMKENAELAFAPRRGGELLLDALSALAQTWGDQFELHLIGHSAGSIVLGHFLTALRARVGRDGGLSTRLGSVHLFAPACSVAFANRHYAVDSKVMERLHLSVLSDEVERDDMVGPYRKSLLYLVSNALETDRRIPILGLARVDTADTGDWDGTSDTGDALATWRAAAEQAGLSGSASRKTVLKHKLIPVALSGGKEVTQRAAHGSFDNDIGVVTKTLQAITGRAALAHPVDDLRGY